MAGGLQADGLQVDGGRWHQPLSHRRLLSSVRSLPISSSGGGPEGPRGPDAVVVPTNRDANQLVVAANLSAAVGANLLVVADHPVAAAELAVRLRGRWPGLALHVVWVPARLHRLDAHLSAWRQPLARVTPYGRVAAKRNLALLVARAVGWRTVLYLDDDIDGLTVASVAQACRALSSDHVSGPAAVAWRVQHFPDNSVVCHARRRLGEPQHVFIGAGALLVDASRPDLPFFGPTYNEDWLFFLPWVARRQIAAMPGKGLQQEAFNPYRDAARAHREEPGDVLAEGLFSLLHGSAGLSARARQAHVAGAVRRAADPDYWSWVLAGRRLLLQELLARAARRNDPRRHEITTSLAAALSAHTQLRQSWFAAFVRAWLADLGAWSTFLSGPDVPVEVSVDRALAWVGLPPALT